MKERFLILDQSKINKKLLINTNTEFYGACRHQPRFHRLTDKDLPFGENFNCTDDAGKAENSQARRARKFKPIVYV